MLNTSDAMIEYEDELVPIDECQAAYYDMNSILSEFIESEEFAPLTYEQFLDLPHKYVTAKRLFKATMNRIRADKHEEERRNQITRNQEMKRLSEIRNAR